MNKKGFTLVELLAVIVVLAVILAIAIPTITSIVDDSRLNAYKNQMSLLKKAAMTYLGSNQQLYPTTMGTSTYIKLSDLIAAGNITSIVDLKDKSACSSSSGVKVTNLGNNNYSYESYLVCTNYNNDYTAPGIVTSVNGTQLTVKGSDQRSITFNGNGQYTQTNGVVTNTTARTYVFDIVATGVPTGWGRIFSANPVHYPDIALSASTGYFAFYSIPLGTNWVTTTSPLLNAGRKKITYVEKNTGEITVYDGTTQIYAGTFTAAPVTTFSSFKLGNRYDVNNERMVGRLFEFQLWNKAFTATDVTNYANAVLVGNETDLVVDYRFNEGFGDKVYDYSVNKNDASVVGGASFTPDGSGIKQIRIKQGVTLINSTTQSTYTFTLAAGTYTVEVEDNVGNISTKSITI